MVITAVALALAVWRRLTGWSLRAAALAVLLAALANPSWTQEQREPLDGIALIVVDDTSSQTIDAAPGTDRGSTGGIPTRSTGRLRCRSGGAAGGNAIGRVPDGTGSDADRGSLVLTELARAVAKIASDRIAGAIIVSDGRIDDAGLLGDFLHLCITW